MQAQDIDAHRANSFLLGQNGMCLKVHVAGSINKSKKKQQSRGSLVMCLPARSHPPHSCHSPSSSMQSKAALEGIKAARMVSVQIDTWGDRLPGPALCCSEICCRHRSWQACRYCEVQRLNRSVFCQDAFKSCWQPEIRFKALACHRWCIQYAVSLQWLLCLRVNSPQIKCMGFWLQAKWETKVRARSTSTRRPETTGTSETFDMIYHVLFLNY